jgi:3-deoxy-manno-octulosonate cytidylyltransferase (CMP-KDO synthetase)
MVIAVIPSRFYSARFPGKALVPIKGIPLVAFVARRVIATEVAEQVWVATDDSRIVQAVERFCPRALTFCDKRNVRSGSDRVAALVAGHTFEETDTILNVQGDEALVTRPVLQSAMDALRWGQIGTAAVPITDARLFRDPDTVKVEIDRRGRALSFARISPQSHALAHLGIYSFTVEALRQFALLPTSPGEQTLHLEQLRALEHGMSIGVNVVLGAEIGSVNRPRDIARVELLL